MKGLGISIKTVLGNEWGHPPLRETSRSGGCFLIKSRNSHAFIAKSNKQWLEICLYDLI